MMTQLNRRQAVQLMTGIPFVPILAGSLHGAASIEPQQAASPEECRRLAAEIEANLREHVLQPWYPRSVDREQGGFHQDYDAQWRPGPGRQRSVVYQARLTWLAATVARTPGFADQAETFRDIARHGAEFLRERMWDAEHGGFFWEVGPDGQAVLRGEKHAYGIAFGIYALSAAFAATQDSRALETAQSAFRWLETRAHDDRHGGYFEALTREGRPILAPLGPNARSSDSIGTRYGYKSMNSHIHLLEAFTALFAVWPDSLVKKRLAEVFLLVRDTITVPPGCMHLFFNLDWKPVPDHDSFGHDVETAFLLMEAAEALHRRDAARTRETARRLVDHALEFGWDATRGGFYDKGSAFGAPTDTAKIWWVQAEGLNALLLMHHLFHRETPRYFEAFRKQWRFIQQHQVDREHGGWRTSIHRDGAPIPGQMKSDAWKDPYHQGRALLHVASTLNRLSSGG